MTNEQEVWLFANCAGTLALADGRLSFCYAPDGLLHKDVIHCFVGLAALASGVVR